MLDLLIHGGQVVTPHRVAEQDVGVQDGRVVMVAAPGAIQIEARRTIDARGKVLVPGGIEPHAHIGQRYHYVREVWSQGSEAASRAAAFGGTTTIVDFAFAHPGIPPLDAISQKQNGWQGRSYVDYTFHCALTGEVPFEHMEQIPEVIKAGVTSFKCFTTFGRPFRDPPYMVDTGHLWAVMAQVARHRGIMAIHGEEDALVRFMVEKLKREGRTEGENLHLVHNNLSEDLAFRKVIRLAQDTGVAIYFLHITAKEGAAAVAEARARGMPIYGEALHNYLFFTAEDYRKPEGLLYHTYPALKYPEDRDALWNGLVQGTVSTVATDDSTTNKEVKLAGRTIENVKGGHNGIETRLPLIFSEGVSKGAMSLQRFVEVTSANAARILGMYPQKGAIAVGSDADLVLIDPSLRKTIRASELHADSDYSIWEGWECLGYPVTTILRGKVIVEDGQLTGSLEDGRFVSRSMLPDVLAGPAC